MCYINKFWLWFCALTFLRSTDKCTTAADLPGWGKQESCFRTWRPVRPWDPPTGAAGDLLDPPTLPAHGEPSDQRHHWELYFCFTKCCIKQTLFRQVFDVSCRGKKNKKNKVKPVKFYTVLCIHMMLSKQKTLPLLHVASLCPLPFHL